MNTDLSTKNVKICESIGSTHHYHLYPGQENGMMALCGKPTIPTMLALDSWGSSGHIGERYCQHCTDIIQETS